MPQKPEKTDDKSPAADNVTAILADDDERGSMGKKLNLGFLVSHGGNSMKAILSAIADGSLAARACVVITNNSNAPALEMAAAHDVPALHLSQTKLGPEIDLDDAILIALEESGADLVILSGYLRKIGANTLSRYQGRILNIHPSLLPKFGGQGMYGRRVHEAVITSGEQISGASVHLVEHEYDTGRVLAQRKVRIQPGDTPMELAREISAIEPGLFVETLRNIAAGRISMASNASGEETDRYLDGREEGREVFLPDHVVSSGSLERLVETARDYASKATAENTTLAYQKDWAHFASWCRRRGADPSTPSPQLVGLYITECAAPRNGSRPLAVSTIERRLAGLCWTYKQQGLRLDRQERHISSVLAGIRRKHAKPPVQKEAVLAEDILKMIAVLDFDLRGLRDRAILLIGFAGGLRRTEIVGLDVNRDDTEDGAGWVETSEDGVVLSIKGKTGWREVEIARGSSDKTCPVQALEQWLHFAQIVHGPVFRSVGRDKRTIGLDRLSDKHVARLIKKTALAAGLRSDLSEHERAALFSGHSLRAGLASGAEVDERYIQKQLGHASPEMTRRYQRRRDRFRINLTKAAGL